MATATVRGGRKLARFLQRSKNKKVTGDAVARALTKVIRRTILPKVRALLPKRTGRLRKSLRAIQIKSTVEIRVVFYGRFQKVGSQTAAEAVVDMIEANRSAIKAQVKIELRNALGVSAL